MWVKNHKSDFVPLEKMYNIAMQCTYEKISAAYLTSM